MNPQYAIVCLLLGAYFLASIPFGLLICRVRGVDVRRIGSGNIGATNVGRALGKPWALLVLVLDALKGYISVSVAYAEPFLTLDASNHQWLVACTMFISVVGHVFPAYLLFRGGKGVATGFGVCLAAVPIAALVGAATYGLLVFVFRTSSIGSLTGVLTTCVSTFFIYQSIPTTVAILLIAAIIVARHTGNIRRLLRGTEPTLKVEETEHVSQN